ncbi:MAG: TIGR02921 family PEP-CTERM protein [Nannocystaceae bacterium]|nr:TIGR02921 family PEP-CTERM protein [Nannocystaceae bacterium]
MTSTSPPPTWSKLLRRALSLRTVVSTVFWSWHAVWICAALFGVVPSLLGELWSASWNGLAPWDLTAAVTVLAVVPLLTAAAGWRLRHDPWRLLGLFYGVAGVVITLLLVRIFLVRELTGGVALLLLTLATGAMFFAARLFGRVEPRTRGAVVATAVGHSALLLIGLWIAAALGIVCVPVVLRMLMHVPDMLAAIVHVVSSPRLWPSAFTGLAFASVAACLAAVVLGLPFAVLVLYTRAWLRAMRDMPGRHGRWLGLAVTAVTTAVWLVAFEAVGVQPQREALARCERVPADAAAQRDDLAALPQTRDGLLNAYLAPYRYWGARDAHGKVARMYQELLDTDGESMQALFDALVHPLLYDGASEHADRRRALAAYERCFDRPLQEGDREAVLQALSATWDRSSVEAGLLDVGNRSVWVREQSLDVHVVDDIGSFELHEVLVNRTPERKEVFYAFTLPERAAVTGLWLGNGPDRTQRWAADVAPRGAAQAVYRAEVQRRVDPALLEQIGPRQYRLRVFPIEPRLPRSTSAPEMHVWLTWTVLGDAEGFELPTLAEARNLDWDDDTTRSLDGERVHHDGWLPPRLPRPLTPRPHDADVDGVRVHVEPSQVDGELDRDAPLAVVIDSSYSMAAHADAAREVIDALGRRGQRFDLFVAPSPFSAELPRVVSPDAFDPVWFGGHTLEGVISQFDAVRDDTRYRAVVVVTDEGSTAFADDTIAPPTSGVPRPITTLPAELRTDEPVWLLHLGALPRGYRDGVDALVRRSGGGVALGLDALLERLGDRDVVDGRRWTVTPTPLDAAPVDDAAFLPLATVAAIAAGGLETDLDRIHALAVEQRVVTPYSSMIVLVEQRQRAALAKASAADDRFDREFEGGVESTTAPGDGFGVSATPEPHEWMLLLLSGLALALRPWQRRRGPSMAVG